MLILKTRATTLTNLIAGCRLLLLQAEQAYKTYATEDRKQYALDILAKQGLKVDWDQVDNMIEAAVNQLPPVQRTATSETMMDGKGE